MTKRVILLPILLAVFVLLIANASAFFIGLSDGYIFDNLGAVINGASVTVTVTGCSGGAGNGCTKTVISDITGYYLATNLNIPQFGTVTMAATFGAGSGSNSGTADISQVVHANVSVCYPPSSPSLTDVPDGNVRDITFSWTPGSDPLGLTKHDVFTLDNVKTDPATSPQSRTGLSYITHAWKVMTCNAYCCSPNATDSFTITCAAPSATSLTAVPDSHNTTAAFAWTSGTDPLSRPTFDRFDLDGNVTSPGVSPITRTGLSFSTHTWRVQTCNSDCCGSWTSDSFVLSNQAPSVPVNGTVTNDSSRTYLPWASGVDPDGDAIYDEFQYANGTIVSPASSPFGVASQLLISWKIRTCDSFGACSAWVSIDTVSCTWGTCTSTGSSSCSGGGAVHYGDKECPVCQDWSGAGVGCRKVEVVCNGLAYALNETLFRVSLFIDRHDKKFTGLSIYNLNGSLEQLEYCPWCYDGVKNYDETGVDCGGSCRDCTAIEQPFNLGTGGAVSLWKIIVGLLLIGAALAYLAYRFVLLKRTIVRRRK